MNIPPNHCVIGIAGRHGVGKDSVAGFLCRTFATQTRLPRYHFGAADALKDEIATCFGVDRQAIERIKLTALGRKILEYVGTNILSRGDFLDYMADTISGFKERRHIILVSGIRRLDEAKLVHSYSGHVILVRRATGNAPQLSETETDDIPADTIVENNGSLQDLDKTTHLLAHTLICKYLLAPKI